MSDLSYRELAEALLAFEDAKREARIKGEAWIKVTKVQGNWPRLKWKLDTERQQAKP